MTNYFYDTEFLDDGETIELISIGIVCEDGREYYAVNADMDTQRILASDWLVRNVWPHLPLKWSGDLDKSADEVKPKRTIANDVFAFLMQSGTPRLWAYYGAYDHVALAQLYGPMVNFPKGMPKWTHDLMQLIEPLFGMPKPKQDGDLHNALADARWNRDLFNAAREWQRDDR